MSDLTELISGTADVICKHCKPPRYDWEGGATSAIIHILQEMLEVAGDDLLERINCADFDDYEYLDVLLQHFDNKLRSA
jgi:hypothetical protein